MVSHVQGWFQGCGSGGTAMQGHIFIQEAPGELDVDDLRTHLQTSECGAIVSFIGITRGVDNGEGRMEDGG